MDGLGGADGGEVAVALVGEDDVLGPQAAGGGGDGGSAAVGGLNPVDVDVVVCKDGASYGSHADGAVFETQLGYHFGDELVHHAVAAAGAVVGVDVEQQVRAFVNLILGFDNILKFHDGSV